VAGGLHCNGKTIPAPNNIPAKNSTNSKSKFVVESFIRISIRTEEMSKSTEMIIGTRCTWQHAYVFPVGFEPCFSNPIFKSMYNVCSLH
jgi:hypothetical protein